MNNPYIRQVKRYLHLPRKAKKEVLRDLQEIFASALEHGETEDQVAERLGSPVSFAKQTAEALGIGTISATGRGWIVWSAAAFFLSMLCFLFVGIAHWNATPTNVIGQANAMTNIRIEGVPGMDLPFLLLLLGIAFAAFAVFATVYRIMQKRRNT